MTISKVVYLLSAYLTERDYVRFGVQTMESAGLQVELWEMTNLVTPKEYQEIVPIDRIWKENAQQFSCRRVAALAISRLGPEVAVVSFVPYCWKAFWMYRALSVSGAMYSVFAFALPTSSTKVDVGLRRLKRLLIPRLILPRLFRTIPMSWLSIRPADIVFAAAEKYTITSNLPVSASSKIVWTHNFDYDNFICDATRKADSDSPYAVFLDEYLPFHPDYAYMEVACKVVPEVYFRQLRDLFDRVERLMGVEVKIAAHPRSDYERREDFFGGRRVIRGRTQQLVRSAEFVILHNSTAINFAVLYRKAMLFVTTRQVNLSLQEDPKIEWLASYFGRRTISFDSDYVIEPADTCGIDETRYATYQNDYIKKTGSSEQPFWEIVASTMRRGKNLNFPSAPGDLA